MQAQVFEQEEVPPGSEFEEVVLNYEENDALPNPLVGLELLVVIVAVGVGLAVIFGLLRFISKLQAAKPCSDDCEPEGSICGECEITDIEILPYGDPSSPEIPDIDEVSLRAKLTLQIPKRLLPGTIRKIMQPFWKMVDGVVDETVERARQLRRHHMRHGVDVWIHYIKPICQRRGDCLKCEKIDDSRKVPALPGYKFLGVTDAWDFNKIAAEENREGFELALLDYLQTLCDEEDAEADSSTQNDGESNRPACVSPWRRLDTVRVECQGVVPSTGDEEKDVIDANARALENGEEEFQAEVRRLGENAPVCAPPCEKIWEVRNAKYTQGQGAGPIKAGQITATGVLSADVYIRCIDER